MTGVSSINMSYTTDALKYINGAEVCNSTIANDVTGAFTSVPSGAAFMGVFYGGGQLLKKTDKVATSIFTGKEAKTLTGKTKYARAGVKGLFDTTGNIFSVLRNKEISNIITAGKGISGNLNNAQMVELVKDLAKAGKSESEILTLLKGAGNNADDIINVLKTQAGRVAKPSKIAKLWQSFKGTGLGEFIVGSNIYKTGMEKATKFLATKPAGQAISKGASKFSKMFKSTGAGVMMVLDGAMALFTDVIPAFSQGGVGEGLKQTAKSGAKVAAGAAGWAVGATAGKAAGAWIGGAIGSVFPVVGTALGAAVGSFVGDMVGGAIGSAVAGKVTEKIVGEDYTDKVQNEAIEQQAAAVATNASSMNELNNYVYQLIQEDMADGKLSKDSEKMLKYLEEGAGNTTNLAYNYNVSGNTGLSDLVNRRSLGDTSVYAVPDNVLEASSYGNLSFGSLGFANSYTNFGYTNPYAASNNAGLNYFG